MVLVAAAPARGGPVYPAGYPGVLRVCGDARCGPGEWSHLATAQADFGACPDGPDGRPGGASLAAARFSALLAGALVTEQDADMAVSALIRRAAYHGPERRR